MSSKDPSSTDEALTDNFLCTVAFDYFQQAKTVAVKLNRGRKVTMKDIPEKTSYQPGWGLVKNEEGVWRYRGLGY